MGPNPTSVRIRGFTPYNPMVWTTQITSINVRVCFTLEKRVCQVAGTEIRARLFRTGLIIFESQQQD